MTRNLNARAISYIVYGGLRSAVDISETGVIVTGAYGDNNEKGSVYVCTPDGAGGYAEQKIVASDAANSDFFGTSVSITESGVILASAFQTDDGASFGAVYVFTPRPDGTYAGPDGTVYTASDSVELQLTGSK